MSSEHAGSPERHLPQPAFPPGSARAAAWRARAAGAGATTRPEGDPPWPPEALILPDDPIGLRPEGGADEDEGEAEATGIGGSPASGYLDAPEGPGAIDPERVAGALETVARVVRGADESERLTDPGSTRFEAALRGFVAGYLRGPGDAG